MLVLSRRLDQAIIIAGQVRVTVLAITPNRVEIGVEAPREILVDREEVHLRRQAPAMATPDDAQMQLSDAVRTCCRLSAQSPFTSET